jgi:hypothetical protein
MKKSIIPGTMLVFLFLLSCAAAGAEYPDTSTGASGKNVPVEGGGLRDSEPRGTEGSRPDDEQIKKMGKSESSRIDSGGINPRRGNYSCIDPSRTEYVALFLGYGGYFPVAEYGKAYNPGHLVSFIAGIYYINFLGLSPELHLRYAAMNYREDPLRYHASLSQVQAFPAIVYRYPVKLPRNTLTLYGRIGDGLSMIRYESRDPYIPIVTRNITEYLNVFGLSAGCYYDVWRGFLVGVDVSYSIVSTARKPLQAVSLMVSAGWRIL